MRCTIMIEYNIVFFTSNTSLDFDSRTIESQYSILYQLKSSEIASKNPWKFMSIEQERIPWKLNSQLRNLLRD